MLRTMREKFKHLSWTLWLVIITFIVGFSMSDVFSKKDPTKADLLTVGEETIRQDKFEQQLYFTLENYNTQFQNKLTQQTINQLRIPEQVLQTLVGSSIINQEAARLNLTVSDEELGRQITENPAFQNNGQFIGRDNYERLLGMRRIQVSDFEDNYRRDILRDKLMSIVTAGITIDEASLRETFTQQTDQVELDYIALTPDTIAETVAADAQEIQAYFAGHKDQYKSPEKRSGRFLFLPFDTLKPEAKLEDNDLFQYYRDHKDEFKIPAKRRISRIFLPYDNTNRSATLKDAQKLAESLVSDAFAQTAQTVSKDAKAASGGDWGETEWQSLSKQEVSIAETLALKQISTPVDSGSGFAILLATEVVQEKFQEFNDLKAQITSILEREKLRRLALELIDKTAKSIKDGDNILEKVSEPKLKKIDSQALASGDPLPGTDELGYLSRSLFAMKPNEHRAPIELPNGMAIAQLIKIHEPAVQTLDQVAEQVKKDIVLQKKAQLLMVKAQGIVAELNAAADEKQLEAVLSKHSLKSETHSYRRGNRFAYYPSKPGLDNTMFSLPLAKFAAPIDLGQAVIIAKAKTITVSSDQDYQTKRSELYNEQLNKRKDDYFAAYIMNQRDRYPIQFNETQFNEIRKNVLARFK